ncbi:hypothetical protein FOA52_007745 [Chlamydomonas sp. UWO 241]|nr:hypothetical protein FOA52_007745 [Chlamydomonas sp. UWO 241]
MIFLWSIIEWILTSRETWKMLSSDCNAHTPHVTVHRRCVATTYLLHQVELIDAPEGERPMQRRAASRRWCQLDALLGPSQHQQQHNSRNSNNKQDSLHKTKIEICGGRKGAAAAAASSAATAAATIAAADAASLRTGTSTACTLPSSAHATSSALRGGAQQWPLSHVPHAASYNKEVRQT